MVRVTHCEWAEWTLGPQIPISLIAREVQTEAPWGAEAVH
jgi:hypothetical protein